MFNLAQSFRIQVLMSSASLHKSTMVGVRGTQMEHILGKLPHTLQTSNKRKIKMQGTG